MACITSPAITDEQLFAFIDGVATTDVVAHVQQCTACQQRAQQLAHLQNRLVSHLYRAECPSSLELGEYHLNLLPMDRVATIEQHLTTCLHCAREIQTLQTFLADLDPASAPVSQSTPSGESFGSQVKRFIAQLVKPSANTSASGGMNPALAGLRGDPAKQQAYEVDGIHISIEVQTEPERPGYKTLLGLVLGLEVAETFEAQLGQVGQTVITTPVDELGNFVFEHLKPGNYKLLLRSAASEIQIEELKL